MAALCARAAPDVPPPLPPPDPGYRPLMGVDRERMPGWGLTHPGRNPILLPYGTTQSAGDGAALLLFTPQDGLGTEARILAPGEFITVTSNRNEFAESVGIRFWARGDGSDADGWIALGQNTGAEVVFPLSRRQWREYRFPWASLPYDFRTNETLRVIEYGMRTPRREKQYLLLDEIDLMPAGEDPASPFPEPKERLNYLTVKPQDPGHILYNLHTRTNGTAGVRFKFRGGGTTRRARVHWEGASDRAVWLDLFANRWEDRRIYWKDMPPPPDRAAQHIVFRFDEPPPLGHTFVFDRLELVRDWDAGTAISPTPQTDPPGRLDPAPFVINGTALQPVIDKLKAKARTSIVVIGDALLSAPPVPYAPPNPLAHLDTAGARLYPFLRAHYRPPGAQVRYDIYQPDRRAWQSLGGSAPWSTGLIVASAILPDAEPRTLDAGVQHALAFAPDLVLLQIGMQHVLYSTPDAYRNELGQAIRILRNRGSLVAVATPPPVAELGAELSGEAGGAWERSREFARVAREVAAEMKCACIDAHAAVLSRGPVAASPLYQDRFHFTIQGHWLLSNLYAHALGVPGRVLWDDLAPTAFTEIPPRP